MTEIASTAIGKAFHVVTLSTGKQPAYETKVYGGDYETGFTYATLAEARTGHASTVALIRQRGKQ